jgi:hypothetical protein
MYYTTNRKLALRTLLALVVLPAIALAGVPAVARAEGVAMPVKDAPAGAPAKEEGARPYEVGITAASMGAFDSNVFDKGTAPTMAAGGDVNVGIGIGVPLGSRVAWASGAGLGSNARQGIDRSAGDANALRVDAHLKTGLEFLLFGKTSMPGRPTKKPRYPALRLAVEAKYAYWSNPFITQPKTATDCSIDALEPTDTTSDGDLALQDAENGGGSDGASDGVAESDAEEGGADSQVESADIPVGAQTFSNPNTHHKLSGATRLLFDLSSRLSLTAEGGGGRDMVRLDDTVQVSPEYNDATADVSAKYKVAPSFLWVTVGYAFERRIYDELNAKGLEQSFDVNGVKVVIDVPLKRLKLKAGYDLRMKSADSGATGDTTRHQVQLAAELPVSKAFAVVADARHTNTIFSGQPDSTRFIGLAGLKAKW